MNTLIKVCGVAIIGLVCATVLRGTRNELSHFASAAVGIVILGVCIALFHPIISYIREMTEQTEFSLYIETILKALGMAIISESAADICRDCGEQAIASKVELAAKASIILLALPLVKSLLALAFGVMS